MLNSINLGLQDLKVSKFYKKLKNILMRLKIQMIRLRLPHSTFKKNLKLMFST